MHHAAVARVQREFNRDVVLAWQIERVAIMAMQRDGGKKLPPLKSLLAEDRKRPQTREEQRAVMYAMSAAFGVPLQKMRRGPDGQYQPIES